QRIVDRVGAGVVGVADDGDGRRRIVDQPGREAIEDGAEVAVDFGTAGGEGNIAGDVQLQAIVRRLRDFDAGAARGFFHLAALVFHAAGPDVAGDRADHAAQGRAANGILVAARGHADQRTDAGADTRTLRGAAFR